MAALCRANFGDLSILISKAVIRRFYKYIIAGAAAMSYFLVFMFPHQIKPIFGGALLIMVLATIKFLKSGRGQSFRFLLTPFLLYFGSLSVLFFLEENRTRLMLTLITTALIYFYLKILQAYLFRPAEYQVNSLNYVSEYLNLFNFFLVHSGLLALKMFLNLPLAPLLFLSSVLTFLILSTNYWINRIKLADNLRLSLIGALLIVEFFAALSTLPVDFFVNALGLTTTYYLYFNLTLHWQRQNFKPSVLWRHMLISCLSLLVVYLTAAWS